MFTEVTSGNIQIGIHYVCSNQVDGAGTITYDGNSYAHGDSFFGQNANDTYSTSDANLKVYEDTTLTDITKQVTAELGAEISPYPESTVIYKQVLAENFSDSDDVTYPETSEIQKQVMGAGDDLIYFQNILAEDFIQNNKNFIPAENKIFLKNYYAKIINAFGSNLSEGINYDDLVSFAPAVTINYDTANNIKSFEANGILVFTPQR